MTNTKVGDFGDKVTSKVTCELVTFSPPYVVGAKVTSQRSPQVVT